MRAQQLVKNSGRLQQVGDFLKAFPSAWGDTVRNYGDKVKGGVKTVQDLADSTTTAAYSLADAADQAGTKIRRVDPNAINSAISGVGEASTNAASLLETLRRKADKINPTDLNSLLRTRGPRIYQCSAEKEGTAA